jgi:hypothetical protein
MKKLTNIIITAIIFLCVISENTFAQQSNKEILEDFFSRENKDTLYQTQDKYIDIAVGQWVLLRKYEGKKEVPVLLKYSVVGKEGENFWIEVKDLRKKKIIIVKFLVKGIEGSSFANAEIIDGKYIQNGEPGIQGMWNIFSMYLYPLYGKEKVKEQQQAEFICAAGRFNGVWGHYGSYSREASYESENISFDFKSTEEGAMLYHTAVPFGLLGWNATNDKAELIEFGFSGAKSEIAD